MKTIVASHNPDLARDFDRDLLRRSDLRLVTALDTVDLLAKLRAGADLCFVDRVLPDGDAVGALAEIRADKKLSHIPVVMVSAPGAPAEDRDQARAEGFAEWIELPAPPGALSLLVGRLLGVALRGDERFAVRVHVFDDSGQPSPETYLGTSIDLSEHGMLLKAKRASAPDTMLDVRFALPGRSGELQLRGRVVRVIEGALSPSYGLALAFVGLSASDRAALHAYLRVLVGPRPFRWELVREGDRQLVELHGVLRADADLSAIAALGGDIWMRMRGFRRISSDSVQLWIDFVHALPAGKRLHLVECPVAFIHQANLITNLLERQEVVSFFAPYACPSCGLEEEKLLDVARDLDGGRRRVPPTLACSSCGGSLVFDELVEQYFAFLERA